jgi:hypothetical protein
VRSELLRRAEHALEVGSADAMLLSLNPAHESAFTGAALVLIEVEPGGLAAVAGHLTALLGPLVYRENAIARTPTRVAMTHGMALTLGSESEPITERGTERAATGTSVGTVRR